jgi:hypothetical protein
MNLPRLLFPKSLTRIARCFIYLFIYSTTVYAENTDTRWLDRFQVHGFASQALIITHNNNFFGNSTHGSAEFTELGLNTSFQLSSKVRLAGQVISRRAGEMYNGSPWVDYALIDINLRSTSQHQLGAYLGRVKLPIGLYNETRDVAHTRQGIFVPQVIYFDKVRNLIMASDGINLYSHHFLSNGTFILQTGVGYPIPDKNVEYAYMGQDWAGKLERNNPSIFGKVTYEHDGGRWISSLSGIHVSLDFNPSSTDSMPPLGTGLKQGEIDIDYTILSVQYNGEKWQFTTEVALEHISYDIGVAFNDVGGDSIGFYSQLDYRFTTNWQAFVRYGEFQLNKGDWNGSKTAQRTGLPAHTNYAKIWVIGGHWNIKQNIKARAEFQLAEGVATLSSRENNIPMTDKYWNLFSISLSYRF